MIPVFRNVIPVFFEIKVPFDKRSVSLSYLKCDEGVNTEGEIIVDNVQWKPVNSLDEVD